MSDLAVRPKLRFWAKMSKKRTRKSDFNELTFSAHEPLEMVKKIFQAFESLNFEVRARS